MGTFPSNALLNFQILRLNKLEHHLCATDPKVPIQVMIVMLEMPPILSNELQDLLSPSFFSRLFGRPLSIVEYSSCLPAVSRVGNIFLLRPAAALLRPPLNSRSIARAAEWERSSVNQT